MPTKEELEAQVAQLARALENLEGKQESGNSTRANKLEKLDLDELTEEKQSETLEVWIAQAKRDLKRKQQVKPSYKEEEYLLDLIDLAKGRLARSLITLERKSEAPKTIKDFEQLIIDTYRIKPAGQKAFDQFKSARQGKRTPRLYLLQLEDWAAVVNQDDALEDITSEQIFFKFKTTIWVSLQDEITAILRRDKCDGRERDLKTINKYLELVEHLYDEAVKKQNDEAMLCRKHHLRLKLVKCYFFQIEVSWLGHQLGNDQIKPDPKLVSSILDYPLLVSIRPTQRRTILKAMA
ncbi:hypothetical protein RI054_31g123960 [Pseudoscourfieldia marina]